ncbi:MAG: hypothetical protein V9E98_12465 [Candidatus Nanopelagicales bacterium]
MVRQASYTGIKCSWSGAGAGTPLNPEKCKKTWIKPIQGIGSRPCVASQQGVDWDPEDGSNPPPTGVSKLQVNSNGKAIDLRVGDGCEIQVLMGRGGIRRSQTGLGQPGHRELQSIQRGIGGVYLE